MKKGDAIELSVKEAATLEVPLNPDQPNLSELVAQITAQNRHPEIPVGKLVGAELQEW